MNKPGEFQQPVNLGAHELEQLRKAQSKAIEQQEDDDPAPAPKKTGKKAK